MVDGPQMDSQLVKDGSPIENGVGPLFDDIVSSQEEQFTGSLGLGKEALDLMTLRSWQW